MLKYFILQARPWRGLTCNINNFFQTGVGFICLYASCMYIIITSYNVFISLYLVNPWEFVFVFRCSHNDKKKKISYHRHPTLINRKLKGQFIHRGEDSVACENRSVTSYWKSETLMRSRWRHQGFLELSWDGLAGTLGNKLGPWGSKDEGAQQAGYLLNDANASWELWDAAFAKLDSSERLKVKLSQALMLWFWLLLS